mgnify:CR=1 FL=1
MEVRRKVMEMIYPLYKNKTINRWIVSNIEEKKVDFEPVTMHGDVNEWLLQGFSIHENPCKTKFAENAREEMRFNEQEFEAIEAWKIYFPWGNPNVEFSHFWFDPTHLKVYAYTQLIVDKDEVGEFELTTCGGAVVLANTEEVTRFMPFSRNVPQKHRFTMPLKKGINTIQIRVDDLAERDTQYFFRLDYLSEGDVKIQLPTDEDSQTIEQLKYFEKIFEKMYFESDFYCDKEVTLHWKEPLLYDGTLTVDIVPGEILADDKVQTLSVKLKKGTRSLELTNSAELYTGYNTFVFKIKMGKQDIQKTLNAQIYHGNLLKMSNDDISLRKKIALEHVAKEGVNDIHRALAMLVTKYDIESAQAIIDKHIDMINHRYDCSDFYLVSLLKIWIDFRDEEIFSEEFWGKIQSCILDFRYWMDEPGDDVMWFFSENHALLFHTCELIAGQIFSEALFTNSQLTGKQHVTKAEERLIYWFERFFEEGITEWNSSAYIPIDILGLVNLYMMSESKLLCENAKKGLDFIFKDLAVNSHKGVLSCTFGRSYTKELKGNYTNGSSFLNWIIWNQGYVNQSTLGTVSLSLSDYTAPDEYLKYLEIKDKDALLYQRVQGYKNYVSVYAYKTKDYILSSATDFKPGQKGYQEHVVHGFVQDNTLFWINHPGEAHVGGSGRPNYWAGNGILPRVVQYKSVALVLYKIPQNEEIDFTHAYFPMDQFDEAYFNSNTVFFRKNSVYGLMYAKQGLDLVQTGETQYREIKSQGYENVWIIQMGHQDTFGSFQTFIDEYTQAFETLDEQSIEKITFTDPQYGKIEMGWESSLMIEKKILNEYLEKVVDATKNIKSDMDEPYPIGLIDINLWEWPQGVGMYGMLKSYEMNHDPKTLEFLINWYDQRIHDGLPEKNVNTMSPMITLIELYEITKKESYGSIAKEWSRWIYEDMLRTKDGLLQHMITGDANDGQALIDTLFMTCLFLAKAGVVFNKKEYVEESIRQFELHIQFLFDSKTNLFFHGWDSNEQNNYGKVHWARGNSWYTCGVVELLDIVDIEEEKKSYLIDILKKQVDSLASTQDESGLWHTVIDNKASYLETSGSAAFAYGILKAVRKGYIDPKYKVIGQGALEGVLNNIDAKGIVQNVSYGTPVGPDERFYMNIPISPMTYGQSLTILLLSEAID